MEVWFGWWVVGGGGDGGGESVELQTMGRGQREMMRQLDW